MMVQMTDRKDVLVGWRTLTVIYALVVLLAISTVVVFTFYNRLFSTHNDYVSTHTYSNFEYSDLNDTVHLRKTEIVVDNLTVSEPAGSYYTKMLSLQYAGYITVDIESSTTDNTFVEVIYTSYGVYYENKIIIIGYRGIVQFPVLPSEKIQVNIGITNLSGNATQAFTITYHY